MMRVLAVAVAAAFIATPDTAGAQGKSGDSPISATRFGISIDGTTLGNKQKSKGLKSSGGKKGSAVKVTKPQKSGRKSATK